MIVIEFRWYVMYMNGFGIIESDSMSYKYNNTKILDQPEGQQNQSIISQQLEMQARSLEEQIQLAVTNYQYLLQIEKKNSADRSEFLIFLIQETRTRQQLQLQALNKQLELAAGQKEEAKSLQKQMATIGEGVDSIVEEGKRLKHRNQSLQRQLQEQQEKERRLDEEIANSEKELQGYKKKIDEWQLSKIKWNRRRKQLLDIIAGAEKQVRAGEEEDANEQNGDVEEELNGLFNNSNHVKIKSIQSL